MQTSDTQRTAVVVDYDAWERSFTTDVLSSLGYRVVGASNGASALRLIEQHSCDVILVDLVLPELRGHDLLQQLRASASTRAIPIILLGATSDSQAYPTQGCVPKPLEGIQVMSEVERCMRGTVSSYGERELPV